MTAIISGIIASAWPYILAGIGGLLLIFQQRRAGAAKERQKQADRERKARDVADQIDEDVGAMPPEDARKELGKWSR